VTWATTIVVDRAHGLDPSLSEHWLHDDAQEADVAQETAIDHERPASVTSGGVWSGPSASGSATRDLARDAHLLEPIIARADSDPTQVVASHRVGSHFVDVTAADFLGRVRALAKGLIASEVRVGDRVAIMSRTSLESVLLDYAILAVGGATVPIRETSAGEQVAHILTDSGAVLAVVESQEMATIVDDIEPERGRIETLVIDDGGLDALRARGRHVPEEELDSLIDALGIGDTATIIYTSGTTGDPKGCGLTHGNLRMNVLQNLDAVSGMLGEDERILLLPLAHSYAKVIALVAAEHGIRSIFSSGVGHLAEDIALAEPTMIVAVARVFEEVFDAAQQRAYRDGRGWIFGRSVDAAVRFARLRQHGALSTWPLLVHAFYDRLVYRKIRRALGGSLQFAFSGGRPLGERLTYFFDGAGVRIFEGYGLTETSSTLTVNRAGAWRPGTVGRPVAGTEIRIASDGEILVSGPQVFDGYWRDPAATYEAFTDDGWFRTGDVGELDDDFLRIIGRKRGLIVTAAGDVTGSRR
jgi:long-chain acyl-CoA synthetase